METTVQKAPAALTVRVLSGRELALECLCNLRLVQSLRDAIPGWCPRCGRGWR